MNNLWKDTPQRNGMMSSEFLNRKNVIAPYMRLMYTHALCLRIGDWLFRKYWSGSAIYIRLCYNSISAHEAHMSSAALLSTLIVIHIEKPNLRNKDELNRISNVGISSQQ